MMTRQAVILAGGQGTRLASRLAGAPKPLVDVGGMPLLKRQLHALAEHGFTHILMLVNYRADAIEEFCASVDIANIQIDVVQDRGGARGTAGAVWSAAHLLHDRFLVVYGDTLFDVNLDRFWEAHARAHEERRVQGSLFLHPNDHPYDSDLVEMDETGMIRTFHPKPHVESAFHRNMVNAALYVLDKPILNTLPLGDGVVDFGKDLFPRALDAGVALQGYVTFEYIKDIGTPDRLDRAVADLRSGKIARSRLDTPQRAVFLDRDGTLNIANGHIAAPEALTLLDGVGEAVARLNRAEYRCILVTNQPVLARGEVTAQGLEAIHAKLETELGRSAAFLDATYVCPHYPETGFSGEVRELKIVCDCRKPAPGLLQRAIADLSIDPAQSWMIGDSEADVGAARAAGIASILVRTGGADSANFATRPDVEVEDLAAAVDFILNYSAVSSKSATPT